MSQLYLQLKSGFTHPSDLALRTQVNLPTLQKIKEIEQKGGVNVFERYQLMQRRGQVQFLSKERQLMITQKAYFGNISSLIEDQKRDLPTIYVYENFTTIPEHQCLVYLDGRNWKLVKLKREGTVSLQVYEDVRSELKLKTPVIIQSGDKIILNNHLQIIVRAIIGETHSNSQLQRVTA